VQWAQVFWPAFEINPIIEFQVKMYETSNRIDFIYKVLSASSFGGFANIGITGTPQ
jgi:hypothetical protein